MRPPWWSWMLAGLMAGAALAGYANEPAYQLPPMPTAIQGVQIVGMIPRGSLLVTVGVDPEPAGDIPRAMVAATDRGQVVYEPRWWFDPSGRPVDPWGPR